MDSPSFLMKKKSGMMRRRATRTRMIPRNRWKEFWDRNNSIILMICAQIFSSLMSITSKLLQTSNPDCEALGTTQILITMLSITTVLCWTYMAVFKVADAPLGPKGMSALLHIRGVAGVFGIWGFYYSLRYLPLSEATIINFLAPMVAAFASTLLIGTPFTLAQQLSGVISLTGVVLVSQPWNMFNDRPPPSSSTTNPSSPSSSPSSSSSSSFSSALLDMMTGANFNYTVCANCTTVEQQPGMLSTATATPPFTTTATSLQRVAAIAAALVGVAGGSAAYVAMAWIGRRAHPVVTVSYFATWAVLLTALGLIFMGFDGMRLPSGVEWALLVFLGVFALGLQLLITASLRERGHSNRALNMVYTQIVFALVADRVVWGVSPNEVSLAGGVLILGSVVAVAVTREGREKSGGVGGVGGVVGGYGSGRSRARDEVHEEEEGEMMVGKEDESSSDDDDDGDDIDEDEGDDRHVDDHDHGDDER